MAGRNKARDSEPTSGKKKPVPEPEKLSPTPGASETEEPQVDEVLPPEERRKYRKQQQERKPEPL
ncbi:MAG TPA: hypothetical protein VJ921_00515 [Vicinamibacteria bacterium]|nr:hypothetical protein [Vicinamibacteria bacterium]